MADRAFFDELIGHEQWRWLDTLEQGISLIREI